MNYVIAFEDDASARDVTRRYAKAFNAKTRKVRVESTRNGERWWNKALLAYEKPFLEDRDEAEVSELTSKSAAEPMPRNIQDFKDHPIYALERHVRRNEVIHPKRVIGHVGLGKTTARTETTEPVYRRSDLHIVRSADKWYRLGRDVKVGEQPLKRVPASRNKIASFSDDEDEDEPEETTLYAEFQTEVYIPPPVVDGKIPKNVYGNLDVYVPSMVPPGGVHINRPEAIRAARTLGIDYADAVTGFEFRGRRGTAVVKGIVIAKEYQEALEEVLTGLEDQRRLAALEARTAEALRFWRLFLVKLRIAERVKAYAVEGEKQIDEDDIAEEMDVEEGGGGFFPEPGQPANSSPPRPLETHLPSEGHTEHEVGSYAVDEEGFGGGFVPEEPTENDSASLAAPAPAPAAEPEPAPKPLVARPTSIPRSITKKNISNTPRYSLVVIPNHGSAAESNEQRESPEPSASNNLEGSSQYAPIAVDSSTNAGSKSASVVTISRPPSPVQEQPKYDSDSELEKGSLLSQDPDDEDAIPDWLMSDEN
jgi:xeroderma pigmentosum group C-complementing protein